MNQNQNLSEIKPEQLIRVMQTVSLALTGSVVMFGVVLFITFKPVFDTHLFAENMNQPIHLILFLMGFSLLLVRIPIANTVFSAALENSKPQDLKSVLQIYFTPLILRLALAESAAIMGFVSTQMSGEATSYTVLAAAALISMLREIPTQEKILEKIKTLKPNLQINH